jgi:hypothetical protein
MPLCPAIGWSSFCSVSVCLFVWLFLISQTFF